MVDEPSTLERAAGFIDLCGFSAYTLRHGDAAAATLVRTMRLVIMEHATSHGAEVVTWTGDGCFLVAREHDALERCCVTIVADLEHRTAVPARAGLAFGELVVLDGHDYVGATVNLAAHRCEHAQPRHVVCAQPRPRRSQRDLVLRSLSRCA